MLHAIKHAHDHAMHHYTLQRLKIAQHRLSLAYGGAAERPWYDWYSRGLAQDRLALCDDVRALNIACAQAYARMRDPEGA